MVICVVDKRGKDNQIETYFKNSLSMFNQKQFSRNEIFKIVGQLEQENSI